MKSFGSQWKERVRKGEIVLGGHIFLPNPSAAELMASFGYEYIWLDGEHGSFDKDSILNHLMAINGAGAGVFVRVTAGEPYFIKPVLEMGPDGIIFPQISSVEEAKRAIDACIYPPAGKRGFGPRRANRYTKFSDREYLDSVDECLVKIVQIEHIDGINNLDSILEIKGIDGIVVGPYDLSGSLGLLAELKHPKVIAAYEKITSICRAHKVPCGVSTGYGDGEYLKLWLDLGINFIFAGDDLGFLKDGTLSTIGKVKAMIKETCGSSRGN
jgi:2-dehydro-3-deoxyglucarate aldolase/4-hydroxy-2-oxoheptanedioate aldolase